jgi:hypothetical protein
MSRFYWSNFPEANSAFGETNALCSSFTTEDFPMPDPRDEHQFGDAARHNPLKGRTQKFDLTLPPV